MQDGYIVREELLLLLTVYAGAYEDGIYQSVEKAKVRD